MQPQSTDDETAKAAMNARLRASRERAKAAKAAEPPEDRIARLKVLKEQTTLRISGVCELSGLSETTVRGLIKSGQLKSFKVGRARLVRVPDFEAFMAGGQS